MAYFSFPSVKDTVDKIIGVEESGKLVVNSDPSEADVYINGEFFGKTPLEEELPVGNYTIRLQKENYIEYFESVNIEDKKEKKLDVELESILPEDEYEGWFTYNNQKKGFGFRYPGDWKITEDNAIVKLVSDLDQIDLTIQDSDVSLSADYLQFPINDNPGYVRLKDNQIVEIYYVLESDEKFLVTKVSISDDQSSSQGEENISDILKKFLSSIWFDADIATEDDYSAPSTDVDSRFVWQIGGSVYSVNADKALQTFDFGSNEIKLLSPDGKWILFQENNGISIIDSVGDNYKRLLLPASSQDGISVVYSVETTGWSPDSRYFVYRLHLYDSQAQQLDEVMGLVEGFYIFDLQTGASKLLDDSSKMYMGNWSNDSKYFYLGSSFAEKPFYINEYAITESEITVGSPISDPAPISYSEYKLGSDPDHSTYQFDVYDSDRVILRSNDPEINKVFLAKLDKGNKQIVITETIKEFGNWFDYIVPRFSKGVDTSNNQGNSQGPEYIITDSVNFYNTQTRTWEKLDGFLYEFDYVSFVMGRSDMVVAVKYKDMENKAIPITMVLIDLKQNKVLNFVYETKVPIEIILPDEELN